VIGWKNGRTRSRSPRKLARLSYFSVMKQQDGAEIEFIITVKEYAVPTDRRMHFFALADKQTNQDGTPYTPCEWGETLISALSDCIRELHRFSYQPKREGERDPIAS
jgi:hypothetical protein